MTHGTIFQKIKVKYTEAFVLLLLFSCLLPAVAFCQPFSYKFNYLTVDDGLSHTDANDIAQDERGFMWVATYFGLDRYDGYSVKKYYNNNVPINNALKNRIACIYTGESGKIWLGTEDGLQYFNTASEKYTDFIDATTSNKLHFSKLYKPAGNFIYGLTDGLIKLYMIKGNALEQQQLNIPLGLQFSDIAPDGRGRLYLSTNKGVWILDKDRAFKKLPISGLTEQNLTRLCFNNRNTLVVTSDNNVFLTNEINGAKRLPFSKNPMVVKVSEGISFNHIKYIAQGIADYWVNTGESLLRLDSNLHLIQLVNNRSLLHSLNSNSLNKIFIDRSECLWVCTFGGGVNFCDLNEKLFYTLQHNPEASNSLSGNYVRSVLEDGENLWIGTTANGLNLYNFATQAFTYYNTYGSAIKLKNDVITSLAFDNFHNLWIGSAAGIEILKPGGKSLWRPKGYENFPRYVIDGIAKDFYGNIWFGNHTDKFGVIWKDKNGYYNVKYYGEGYFILADNDKPQLLISSTHGLQRLLVDKEGSIIKSFHYTASITPNSLSSDYTYPLAKQNDSTYWIGTIGGGLNRLVLNNDTYNIKAYTAGQGVFNDVESLEIDNSGNIWMGGNGLERLDPKTGKITRFDKNDGLQGNSFKVGSSCKGAYGRLYFGGINGLNYFDPEQIKINEISPEPVLTEILINNQKTIYGSSGPSQNPDTSEIAQTGNLKLSYLQNNFVIFFSSMHYANPLKCKYRYQLAGFDKGWKYTDGSNPNAAYSNLEFNSYKFIVQATNNDGVWGKGIAEAYIIITPPWWKSTAAKTIYALLLLASLAGIYIYQARWYRLKRELEVRGVNEEKREEMHRHREHLYQQQLIFFTNISHEFRTPLTLILGPLESLISQNKNPELQNFFQLMLRNAKRMTNLISELMNFKKVADSVISLYVEPLAVSEFCKGLAGDFQVLAISKGIKLKVSDLTEKETSEGKSNLFDVQILEKILFNLLSNSFKYTNSGGQVLLELFFNFDEFKPSFNTSFKVLSEGERAKKYIYFRVADSGIGISSDSITKIFDRYYRVSNDHLGSGVGLAMVKTLTQIHKGDIYVYSERNKGTEIIIGLPWGKENYDKLEKMQSKYNIESQFEVIDESILLPMTSRTTATHRIATSHQKRILIVDDNDELRSFLKQAFEKHYYIYEAENGDAALRLAVEKIPDLIISDVMMPGMNGIEFCRLVKETFETRHIPFIILSAKDALETKIEGMESGADFYFAKPLSIDLLQLTVHNIFQQGEKLKLKYTNNYLSEATELVNSEKDKDFVNSLLKLIESNIQDVGLDVDFLCDKLFISRTKLYQKIKSISGQSVAEFIRTIRLKKAIQIMTHEGIPMNEVADRIGLQSSSNFSRAFKKEYGKSPLQFLQILKSNNLKDEIVEQNTENNDVV